jgi:hypothetical protein
MGALNINTASTTLKAGAAWRKRKRGRKNRQHDDDITIIGKLMGLIRDRLFTISYGTGMEANAFFTARPLPRVFFDAIFASAIAMSFIPVFGEYMQKKGKDAAIRFPGISSPLWVSSRL